MPHARAGAGGARARCCAARSTPRRAPGYDAMAASELEYYLFRDVLPRRRRKGYRRHRARRLVPRGLPPPPGRPHRGLPRRGPPRTSTARACPSSRSKGEWGLGQHELNIRYAEVLEMADRHAVYKQCLKELADRIGRERHLHGEAVRRPGRLELPHPPEPLAAAAANAFAGDQELGRRRLLRRVPVVPRRLDRPRPRRHGLLRPDGELLQALPGRLVGAHAHRLELRQPHRRLPRRRPRPEPADRVPHPRRRLQPLPRLRRHARLGPRRHRAADRAAAVLRAATSTRPPTCRGSRAPSGRRSSSVRRQRLRRGGPSATTSSSTTPTSSAPSGRPTTPPSPTGSGSATSRGSELWLDVWTARSR